MIGKRHVVWVIICRFCCVSSSSNKLVLLLDEKKDWSSDHTFTYLLDD